jgi:hypothetical protein
MNNSSPAAKSCKVRVRISGQRECCRTVLYVQKNEANLARDQSAIEVSLAIVIGTCIHPICTWPSGQIREILLFCTHASYICAKCAVGSEHLKADTDIWTTQSSQGSGSTYTIHLQQHLKGVQMSTHVYFWQRQTSTRARWSSIVLVISSSVSSFKTKIHQTISVYNLVTKDYRPKSHNDYFCSSNKGP